MTEPTAAASTPTAHAAASHLDELTVEECLARLATERVGRLAVMVNHYPQIFVVNYVLDDFVVVFRTHVGSHLLAAHHTNIGFQVEHLDTKARLGWTVLIQGMAEDVTDRAKDATTERGRHLDIDPWVPGEMPRILRIIPAKITGRQLYPGDPLWATDDRGYL